MIVVIDTSVWRANIFLNSPAWAAIRFYLYQSKARIGMPEVIRREVEEQTEAALMDAIRKVRENHEYLLRVFGQMKELVLPDEDSVRSKAKSIIDALGIEIIDMPLSLESARSSFEKILKKMAPSAKNSQQFKDGVVWADCLALAERDHVVLVTNDKAFFEQNDPAKGVAKNLLDESERTTHKVRLFSRIDELMVEVRIPHPEIPIEYIIDNLLDADDVALKICSHNGFAVRALASSKYRIFATERPNVVYISFEITYSCRDVTDEHRDEALLTITGETDYNTDSKNIGHIRRSGDILKFKGVDDAEVERKGIYASAHITIGHADVYDVVRFPLPD